MGPGPTRQDDGGPVATTNEGHSLRAPSSLHAFNRYEIKYLISSDSVPQVLAELQTRLDRDAHSPEEGYGVWSVYYDTASLRFYWEKIEGLRFRRKIRVRHYGDRTTIDDDTLVYVEIKQRVNRVTQKRRIALPYREARALCDARQMIDHASGDRPFINEVLGLVQGLDLRATAITGYQRQAFVGRDADIGLRVTLDHRIRGRDRDFQLNSEAANRFALPPHLSVLEVKANERVPYWMTDLTARLNLNVARISKYCQSIEAFGRAPRSIFHIPDDDTLDEPTEKPRPATQPIGV